MSPEDWKGFHPRTEVGLPFLSIIQTKVSPHKTYTSIDIEILSPTVRNVSILLGKLSLVPEKTGFGISYFVAKSPEEVEETGIEYESEPAWKARLDLFGNVRDLQSITEEEFYTELGFLIDPESIPHDPDFKLRVIEVHEGEGDFDLPDAPGWKGRHINEDVHTGGIAINFK